MRLIVKIKGLLCFFVLEVSGQLPRTSSRLLICEVKMAGKKVGDAYSIASRCISERGGSRKTLYDTPCLYVKPLLYQSV